MTHSAAVAPPMLDELCVNTLRFLAVDAVQKAKSGHPGLPLGSASMAYVLWDRWLAFNPHDPFWPDRDRLVLPAEYWGHRSGTRLRADPELLGCSLQRARTPHSSPGQGRRD